MKEWVQLKRPRVYGAPLLLHWSVFVVVGLLALIAVTNPLYALLFIACYLTIIFLHEIGHAVIANRLGYRVFSIHITFWHGWCTCEATETEWEHALIAWGGCLAQFAIAFPVLLIMVLLGDRDWGC